MTPSEAEKLVAILEAGFPYAPTKPETATVYHLMLPGVPYETALAAATWWGATDRRFPTAADIRDRVRQLERGVTISDLALAAQLRQMLGQDVLAAGATAPALMETTT